jgi:hypothetical protein
VLDCFVSLLLHNRSAIKAELDMLAEILRLKKADVV